MSDYVQAAVTILALINPAICAVIFSSAEHGRDSRNQVGDATKAAAAILIILAVAAVAGASVLSAFGISLDAFQVAGSVVLVWMGFSMLTGSGHSGSPEGASGGAEAPSLLPRRSRSVSLGFCCWRRSGWAERVDRATSSPPVSWV